MKIRTRRRLFKTLSWELSAGTLGFILSYLWFGDVFASVGFAVLTAVVFPIYYYIHETMWEKWGTN